MFNSARKENVKNNRHYLKSVCEILLLCSRLETGLRGHDESQKSQNRGNFLEIFNVLSNHDQILTKRLNDGPQNALYISPLIQNSLLNIMGSMVRRKICDDIRKSVYYPILAD